MLTSVEFHKQLVSRRQGTTLASIGRELGVSRQAVDQWIQGHTEPSGTVLLLAEHLWRAPRELPAGLPANGQEAGG